MATKFVANSTQGNPDIEVILLTERGYLMLVRSFNDDLAWEVQDRLVEFYFRAKSALAPRAWSTRLDDYLVAFRREVNNRHPGWWAVATELMADLLLIEDELFRHGFPLDATDLPDGSVGGLWRKFREAEGSTWVRPCFRDCPLSTPHFYPDGKPVVVYPYIYDQSEMRYFRKWFQDHYAADRLPRYLDAKVKRDNPKWIGAGIAPPRDVQVALAANDACVRLTGSPARLPGKMQRQLTMSGPRQAEMF